MSGTWRRGLIKWPQTKPRRQPPGNIGGLPPQAGPNERVTTARLRGGYRGLARQSIDRTMVHDDTDARHDPGCHRHVQERRRRNAVPGCPGPYGPGTAPRGVYLRERRPRGLRPARRPADRTGGALHGGAPARGTGQRPICSDRATPTPDRRPGSADRRPCRRSHRQPRLCRRRERLARTAADLAGMAGHLGSQSRHRTGAGRTERTRRVRGTTR